MENKESVLTPDSETPEKQSIKQPMQQPPAASEGVQKTAMVKDSDEKTSSQPATGEKPLVKPLKLKKFNKGSLLTILASFLIVLLGVATGWFLAGKGVSSTSGGKTSSNQVSDTKDLKEAGVGDPSSYQSSVEGVLKEGGIKGEGTHYLDRDLGESKYVYLTSSVIDLNQFVGKKVTVWGDTISARYASWLIDVGLIKVVD